MKKRSSEVGSSGRDRNSLRTLEEAVLQRTRELSLAREELLKKNDELSKLLAASRSLIKSASMDELLGRVLEGALQMVPSESGALLIINRHTGRIELSSFHNIESLPLLGIPHQPSQLYFNFDDSYLVADDPRIKALIRFMDIPELLQEKNKYYVYENGLTEGVRGILTVLLKGMEGVEGVLCLINRIGGDFCEEDASFLSAFANEAAVSIENLKMHFSLLRKEMEIERQKRLANIGEMSAQIAHEIRNPLQKILTGVEYLRDYCNPQDTGILEFVTNGVASINRIVSKMVEYGRPSTLNLQETDVRELIEETIEGLKARLLSSDIAVTTEFSGSLSAFIDPVRFGQGLRHVFDNAVDAMPNGGRITVALRCLKGDTAVLCNIGSRQGSAFTDFEIRIADTGVGMDKKDLDKLFTPFFTTKTSGSGLGMAMLKKIVDRHSGEVHVKSEVGTGTEVLIRMPVQKHS